MKAINFMGQRKLAMLFSVALLLVSIGSLATRQLNWGLDFTGGTLVEVHYSETADLNAIRNTLDTEGYSGAIVVSFGTDRDVMIRLPKGYSDKQGAELLARLQEAFAGSVELRRIEFVGPQVGDELREQGGLAMLLALGLVMLYIAFRFQFKFAVGAVVALVHDVIVTLGFFSITAMEFDLLRVFTENPNRALNRDQIMELAHHRDWDVYDRSIDLRIMRLRRKIERDPEKPEAIKTVRGVGYMYVKS